MSFNQKIRIITGCCIIHLLIGSLYMWGTISTFINSYFRKHNNPNLTFTRVNSLFIFISLIMAVFFQLGLRLAQKVGPHTPILIASLLNCICLLVSTYCNDFYLFFFMYGVLQGMTIGVLYLVVIFLGVKQFPKRSGLVTGIIVGCFALGSVFDSFLIVKLLNPDNLSAIHYKNEDYYWYPDQVTDNLPIALRWMGLYYIVLTVLGNILIRTENKSVEEEEEQVEVETAMINNDNNFRIVEQKEIYILFMMMFSSQVFLQFISLNYKSYGYEKINDDNYLSLIVGNFASFANGFSRFFAGYLLDKFGFRRLYGVILGISLVLNISLDFISADKVLYCIWVTIIMCVEGFHFVIFPSKCVQIFGIKNGSIAFSCVNFGVFFANIFQLAIYGNFQNVLTFQQIFYIFFGLTSVSFILNIYFKLDPKEFQLRQQAKQKELKEEAKLSSNLLINTL